MFAIHAGLTMWIAYLQLENAMLIVQISIILIAPLVLLVGPIVKYAQLQ